MSAAAAMWGLGDYGRVAPRLELAGPYAAARQDLPPDRYAALREGLLAAIEAHAEPEAGGGIAVRPRYLLAVARAVRRRADSASEARGSGRSRGRR